MARAGCRIWSRAGSTTPEQLIVYTPEYFRKERNIEVRTGARVVSDRSSATRGAARIGRANPLRAPGDRDRRALGHCGDRRRGRARMCSRLHTLDDAERMRRFLREKRPKTAAMVGAGYIGVEAADALRRRGLRVTVVRAVEARAAARRSGRSPTAVRKQLEQHGVELRCGVGVNSVDEIRRRHRGDPAGFKPNVELAADAGVELGRTGAIRTDDRMETNLRGVFAAGDCAEVQHIVTGRPTYIPLGTTANKAGRVAGANAAGARERFAGIVGTSIVGIFGMGFATTGFSAEQARAEGFSPVSRASRAARGRVISAEERPRWNWSRTARRGGSSAAR